MSVPAAGVLTVAQQELLRLIAGYTAPVTVAELSRVTGRHVNSVRELVQRLYDGGHVERVKLAAERRGRRAWGYSAPQPDTAAPARQLAELSGALSTVLARSEDPVGQAYAVGLEWGREYRGNRPGGDVGPEALSTLMRGLGYEPEPAGPGEVELHSCPLRTSGGGPHPLVCHMHRGLVDGLCRGTGSDVVPFVRPDVCLVRLPVAVAESA